jgi:hypothetical protein
MEAYGGETSPEPRSRNRYEGRGDFRNRSLRFGSNAEISFFLRSSDHPYEWGDKPWISVLPGEDLRGITGRYVQIAADFYPGQGGETSPYLEELALIYESPDPPAPPARMIAQSKDGGMILSWDINPDPQLSGYLVYYGDASGHYLGEAARVEGKPAPSPIDAGKRNSLRLEGLRNGKLYFFAVAAYAGDPASPVIGEYSREVSARPLPEGRAGIP